MLHLSRHYRARDAFAAESVDELGKFCQRKPVHGCAVGFDLRGSFLALTVRSMRMVIFPQQPRSFRLADYSKLIEWSSVAYSHIWRTGHGHRLPSRYESNEFLKMLETLVCAQTVIEWITVQEQGEYVAL